MWNTFNNICSSNTIFPSFYTSQASNNQPLCFKSFIMASYQSVVNINIIMKFLIGHKAFVSLCTLSHCRLLSLTEYHYKTAIASPCQENICSGMPH